MIVESKDVVSGSVRPVRISRFVSVILNGFALRKLANQHNNDVNVMAEILMLNLSKPVKKNLLSHEIPHVHHSLRAEIGRRISLPQVV